MLKDALELANDGYHIFPLSPNTKDQPIFKEWTTKATKDPKQIKTWWTDKKGNEIPYNIGISTSSFNGGKQALLVVDVDVKEGKKGDETLLELELEGKYFPVTDTQTTPTGGKHYIYTVDKPVKQGVNVLGTGLDIRSKGGFIVGKGSTINGNPYTRQKEKAHKSPLWIVKNCGKARVKDDNQIPVDVSYETATKRAIDYLVNHAPESIKGDGGDHTAYSVACRVKDFGVYKSDCLELMMDHWFEGSGWSPEKLQVKIDNAYDYGTERQGIDSPQADFDVVEKEESYLTKMNREFALVFYGGSHSILHHTHDNEGRKVTNYLGEKTFSRMFSNKFVIQKVTERKTETITKSKAWLNWDGRREYKGLCFSPGKEPQNGYYNTWKGFTVDEVDPSKATADQIRGLKMYKDHILENVCDNNISHFNWVIGFLAHMIQKPYIKPQNCLVLKGRKGVGKNVIFDRVGQMLGDEHYMVAQDSRYLTSNFNNHLEKCLMMVLDEAFWSGDKSAEGKLKGIITSPKIMIEQKGKDPYQVKSLTRFAIIGNEDWLVPASQDERRYAVFNVGDARIQDNDYFDEMRELLDDKGGNGLLLHYLKNFDLSKVDLNKLPDTQGLNDQKELSLPIVHRWWRESLVDGRIQCSDFNDGWAKQIGRDELFLAFGNYEKRLRIRYPIPKSRFLKQLNMVTNMTTSRPRDKDGKVGKRYAVFDSLDRCRKQFDKYMNFKNEWDKDDDST